MGRDEVIRFPRNNERDQPGLNARADLAEYIANEVTQDPASKLVAAHKQHTEEK